MRKPLIDTLIDTFNLQQVRPTTIAIVVGRDIHDELMRALQRGPEPVHVIDGRGLKPRLPIVIDSLGTELRALATYDESWPMPLSYLDGFVTANPEIPIELEPPPSRYRAILALVAVFRGVRAR